MVPNSGTAAGGTTVVLTGTDLTGATAVSFGATPAASFTVDSATQITAVSPAGTGTVQVTATTVGGTTNGVAYTYIPVPALANVVPNSGPVAGGTTVVLTGTDLTGTTAVDFGATPAASFTVDSATQITAVSPAGTGTVQVTATTAGGTSNGVAYTFVPVPALTTVVPNSGSAAGGTTVVLTGTDLTGATDVSFGATPATSFTVDSATQITAVSSAGTGTVLAALDMAIAARSPDRTVIYSDHGAQFTSWAFSRRITEAGLVGSMGTIGDGYGNAMIESFWSRMQIELLDRKKWKTRTELANAIFDYIEIFHNRQRRHSSIGWLTPAEFEKANRHLQSVS